MDFESEELRDFLPFTPSRLIRYGNFAILGVAVVLLTIATVVKYPDTISGNITITTQASTVKIVNKSSGKISRLLLRDDSFVREGTVIAEIESSSSLEDINKLKGFLKGIIIQGDTLQSSDLHPDDSLKLGEAQNDYSLLLQNLVKYNRLQKSQFYPA